MLIDYWRFARANPRFIGFGFLLALLSSGGQTYFIGVLGTGIQAEFALDAGEWGRIYMIGTLASAFVLNWSGSLIDRYDLRWFTLAVLLGLIVACLVMSSVSAPLMLIGAIFLLRQFGQGLTSHTGVTSMARYHDADRGKAIALASIGFSVGEATLPVLGVLVLESLGWRQAFQMMAVLVAVAIPIALWLLKGHGIRHAEHTAALDRREAEGGALVDYNRMQVLREPRFYLILPALMAPAAIGTAMFFFPAEIVRAKQWSGLWLTGNYWLYSLVTVTVMVSSGALIDRFSARQVVPYYLLPFVVGLVILGQWDHAWAVWPYLGLMGFSIGLYFTGFSALWAELYGARHLGAIKSLATAINVFATALGPAFMGTLLSNGVPFAAICLIFAAYCLGATLFLVYALRTPSR